MATEGGRVTAPVEPRPASASASASATADPSRPPQPLRPRPVLATVVVGYAVLVVAFAALGYQLVHADLFAGLRDLDDDINRWMAAHRTDALDAITGFWTTAINTVPAIVVALLLGIRLGLWRRWREVVLVASGLALELSVFLTVNALVDRPRPDVHRLGDLPQTSSFPSGHMAATIVLYGSVALFVSLSHRRALVQGLAWAAVVFFAGSVAFSRVYRGMHHPTDVLAGALLGVACLSVAIVATQPWQREARRP
jgi:membrane-associated phospholipid phosphatase